MTPFDCYKLYVALKNHFQQPSYDYFKYNGKSKASVASFEKRADRFFFSKLAKHNDCRGFIVANLCNNSSAWVRDIAYSPEAQQTYAKWLATQQSLLYKFNQDLKLLKSDFNSNIVCSNNTHPYLVSLLLKGSITIETVCIISKLVGCTKYWRNALPYDPVIDQLCLKIDKYTPFIDFDVNKYKQTVVDFFANTEENDK
jgi:hypothetical protein